MSIKKPAPKFGVAEKIQRDLEKRLAELSTQLSTALVRINQLEGRKGRKVERETERVYGQWEETRDLKDFLGWSPDTEFPRSSREWVIEFTEDQFGTYGYSSSNLDLVTRAREMTHAWDGREGHQWVAYARAILEETDARVAISLGWKEELGTLDDVVYVGLPVT